MGDVGGYQGRGDLGTDRPTPRVRITVLTPVATPVWWGGTACTISVPSAAKAKPIDAEHGGGDQHLILRGVQVGEEQKEAVTKEIPNTSARFEP